MTERTLCLETELRRLSKLEDVSPYVQARLEDAADAIRELVEKLNKPGAGAER